MTTARLIQPIRLPVPGIDVMRQEAHQEGFKFLETLVDEWQSGENRFDGPGETLQGHLDCGVLVAVGGLNIDPFLADLAVGRIRRVYVRRTWRDAGLGSALLDALVGVARQTFSCVRLRAESPRAARLYERKGFEPIASDSATHRLLLRNSSR